MKKVKLSIVEDYVSHWSWWEGVRELLQNAIDTKEYEVDFLSNAIKISSHGGKIPTQALLMGRSSKQDDVSTIGKFGEGMKLGFLVLIREGAKVHVNNFSDVWEPAMEMDDTFDQEILCVNIHENILPMNQKVEVVINDIPAHAMAEIKEKFAPQKDLKVAISNDKGTAYFKDREGSDCNLYVSGLFVCSVQGKYKFDYDFKPDVFELDRDRDSVSEFNVQYYASQLISESDDIELLVELAMEEFDDLKYFEGRRKKNSVGKYWGCSLDESEEDILTDHAVELFEEKYGYDAVPINDSWSQEKKSTITKVAISKGFTPIAVKKSLYSMIQGRYNIEGEVNEILKFDALEFLENFLKKYERKLYNKPRKEIENVIFKLKLAKEK